MSEVVQVPPQSKEGEYGALGSMIVDSTAACDVAEILTAEDFFDQQNRIVFNAITSIMDEGKALDLVLIRNCLKQEGLLEAAGGIDHLQHLVESVPSATNAKYYARMVKQCSRRRQVIGACHKATDQMYSLGDVDDALEKLEKTLLETSEGTGREAVLQDILPEVLANINSGNRVGLETGFRDLDMRTGGLMPGEVTVIAARPSMGKTALALNIGEHVAIANGQAVAVFSLEMTRGAVVKRILCGRAHVDSRALLAGLIGADDRQRLTDTAAEIKAAPLIVNDNAELTPMKLRAAARRLHRKHKLALVVIDYLQLMHAPGQECKRLEVGFISRQIKALARELNIPVLLLSQLNRAAESREGHLPRLSDLRESGDIEQDADVVLLLHRPDYYQRNDPKYEPTNKAEVIIAKQRNGPTGSFELAWMPGRMQFGNCAEGAEQ